MSAKRISGKDFHIFLDGMMVHVESASLSIEDSRGVAKTGGVPNGYVDGEVAAQGELTLDPQNFLLLSEAAARAGSWKGLRPFDMTFVAATSVNEQIKVEAFGCLLKIDGLLDIDPKGTEKSQHKLTFDVTDSDFIKINGIPYLEQSELIGIVQ